ncbi:hypothetical protein B14_200059 (plasmid) [Bacillus licheniformis]|uniref:hypothetical protein n=1 Tax=Bacillus TaxID=1386 RepID=UPI0009B726A4|nr:MULTISPECIES: hypothetical protein [Bacillus]ARC67270.1 hypothetical protein B14_200059 [Bacillus licheniformis]ARW46088.1 hypothetical protein S100141_04868 [Bacillus licheniformis]MCY8577561.1 hypothetical protein [Bacillus haynesii]MDE1421925.1 hypothetical protein [Bacillus licheniformis]MEC0475930.1 hypothetical protein [Bacillus licheniformis]
MKMQVILSPEEVKQIVKNHLEKKFDNVGKVKLEVGRELRGHYTNEHYEPVFKGAKCEVEAAK